MCTGRMGIPHWQNLWENTKIFFQVSHIARSHEETDDSQEVRQNNHALRTIAHYKTLNITVIGIRKAVDAIVRLLLSWHVTI